VKALSSEPDFNVTLLGSFELEEEIKDELELGKAHFIGLPHLLNQTYPAFKKSVLLEMYEI
jgi:hypothetical protein